MILAATNHPQILDYALFRRFDDVIEYALPDKAQIQKLIENKLAGFAGPDIDYQKLAITADGLSFAEIARACEDAIKEMIISDKQKVTGTTLARMIDQRKKCLLRIY
jgi:AAA+ superfamily predicted ATPase